MKQALIVLANGFEEIEAVTPIDLLRRAGIQVTVAGLDSLNISGGHSIVFHADVLLNDVKENDFDLIILPGGGGGTANLMNSDVLLNMLQLFQKQNKLIAAICAAPMVLAKAGVTMGQPLTSYPGTEDAFEKGQHKVERVVVSGKMITSRGPATAIDFSLELIKQLLGQDKSTEIAKQILYID